MNSQELIKQYFNSKTQQLLAACDEVISEHPGLKGGHREELVKLYLNDITPKKFDIGRGMIYSPFHKSKEADVVIWDNHNYPSLQFKGNSLFFAESARLMLEVKSRFNSDTLNDILGKCEATKNIVPMRELTIEDEIFTMRAQINSLITGESFEGILHSKHHIATGAFVFKGGENFRLSQVPMEIIHKADDVWPDIMILLEAGKVIVKHYDEEESYIELLETNTDSLLYFTSLLLGLLVDRSVNIEDPFYLNKYVWSVFDSIQTERVIFRPTRWIPGRTII